MALQTYEDLEVYQKAMEHAGKVFEVSKSFPKDELYGGLTSQLRRSSTSICANTAEGLSKQMSLADKKRFLQIARGSAEETRVWLSLANKFGYVDMDTRDELREAYSGIARMLYKLLTTLKF